MYTEKFSMGIQVFSLLSIVLTDLHCGRYLAQLDPLTYCVKTSKRLTCSSFTFSSSVILKNVLQFHAKKHIKCLYLFVWLLRALKVHLLSCLTKSNQRS